MSLNGAEVTLPKAVIPQSGDSEAKEHAATGTPAPIEHPTVEDRAPIEGSTIVPPETAGGPYTVKITSGLPSACAQFSNYYSSVHGNDYSVEVIKRVPADGNIAGTSISGYYDG